MLPHPDYVFQLIARSTGIFGDFKMPICAQIVAREHPFLSDEDLLRILRRYRSHVEFWNVSPLVIQSELQNLAIALGGDMRVQRIYESLNWVGLMRYQCDTDFTPWTRALQSRGLEFKTWFGPVSKKCYILVRGADHANATMVIQTQYWQNQFELVQLYETIN